LSPCCPDTSDAIKRVGKEEEEKVETVLCALRKKYQSSLVALAQWRHRIRLWNRRPGFESRQGERFLGKYSNAVVCMNFALYALFACLIEK
jgi:hypothetical protein